MSDHQAAGRPAGQDRIPDRKRRRSTRYGRRRWDLPPRVAAVLIAWAAVGPAIVAVLVQLLDR